MGSGKTVIALLTALPFITSGYQVAYMAPTEILAQQIFDNLKTLITSLNIFPILLTGSTKNKPEIYDKIKKNEINFVIGTCNIPTETNI